MFCRNLLLLRRLITLTRKLRDSNDMEYGLLAFFVI